MRFSELQRKVKESDDAFKLNTISGTIWNFDTRFPNDVYKPSKGLFRLKKFKESEVAEVADSTTVLLKVLSFLSPQSRRRISTSRSRNG
jgi:hypothetical protein